MGRAITDAVDITGSSTHAELLLMAKLSQLRAIPIPGVTRKAGGIPLEKLSEWAEEQSVTVSISTLSRWQTGTAVPAPKSYPTLHAVVAGVRGEYLQRRGTDLPQILRRPVWDKVIAVLRREAEARKQLAKLPPPMVYQGLAPYGRGDARRFHGRRADIEQLLRERLDPAYHSGGPVLVYAESGAGQSSFLAAGVVPALAERGLPSEPDAATWPVISITPGECPLEALSVAMPTLRPHTATSTVDLAAVRSAVTQHAPNGMLLVVDQFEEVFQPRVTTADRERVVELLMAMSTAPDGHHAPALVIIAARHDFYPQVQQLTALGAARDAAFNLRPLDASQLREAITGPARSANITMTDELVARMMADANVAARGSVESQLPLISQIL
ncbi:MAG: hypothetical protein ACRD0H_11605, partial [Actinomycetes bacterium]